MTKPTQTEELSELSADAIKTAANLPATTTDAAVAVAGDDPWGEFRDQFNDGSRAFREHFGLSVPRLRTDFGRNGKGWVDELSGEAVRELEVVLLAYPPSRAWWEVSLDEGGGGVPDCRSHDMIAPEPSSPKRQSDLCANCPHSKWGPNNERPSCAESVNVLAYDVRDDLYVWLRFGGTSLRPFNQFVSYLTSKRLPAFAVTTKVDLEVKTKDRLEWLVPRFSMGDQLTPEQVRPMREMAKAAMDAWQQVAEEMAAQDAQVTDAEIVYGADEEPF